MSETKDDIQTPKSTNFVAVPSQHQPLLPQLMQPAQQSRGAVKTVMTTDNHILEELQQAKEVPGTAQSKLKSMWNKIRTKIMVDYIKLIDNCIIVVWFGVMLLNVYTVGLDYRSTTSREISTLTISSTTWRRLCCTSQTC